MNSFFGLLYFDEILDFNDSGEIKNMISIQPLQLFMCTFLLLLANVIWLFASNLSIKKFKIGFW